VEKEIIPEGIAGYTSHATTHTHSLKNTPKTKDVSVQGRKMM